MSGENRIEDEFLTWRASGCPFTIAYPARLLDDIRVAIVDAFFSLPKGGVEIGGVLLGKYDAEQLCIVDYAPLACEHAFGPSFTLSRNDQKNLEELLLKLPRGADGLEPVGWYHSHTRTDIFLSEADLDIYRRYFPKQWQVALVLRPSAVRATRAGFFFREEDGSVYSAASRHEFVVDPTAPALLPRQPQESLGRAQAAGALSADVAAAARSPVAARETIAEAVAKPTLSVVREPFPAATPPVAVGVKEVSTPPESVGPAPRPFSPEVPGPRAATALAVSPAAAEGGAPPPHPAMLAKPAPTEPLAEASAFLPAGGSSAQRPEEPLAIDASEFQSEVLELENPNSKNLRPKLPLPWRVIMAALLAGVGVGIAAVKLTRIWMPLVANLFNQPAIASVPASATLPPFGLNAVDANGQLQVRWDSNSRAVREARQAVLTISDAGSSTLIPLDKQHLASGAFAYARQGERVDVKLSLQQADGSRVEEATGFLGKLPERKSGPENPGFGKERGTPMQQDAPNSQVDRTVEAAGKKAEQSSGDLQAEPVVKKRVASPSFDPLGP